MTETTKAPLPKLFFTPAPLDLVRARHRLNAALRECADAGQTRPCERVPDLWVSEDWIDLAKAAMQCRTCPVLWECGAEADADEEAVGVWGGRIREPRSDETKECA